MFTNEQISIPRGLTPSGTAWIKRILPGVAKLVSPKDAEQALLLQVWYYVLNRQIQNICLTAHFSVGINPRFFLDSLIKFYHNDRGLSRSIYVISFLNSSKVASALTLR